jgi:chromosome segregation ATPase
MTTDIKFHCDHCGQRIVVDSEAAGLATECPSCRTNITIPKVAAMHDREYRKAPRKRENVPMGLGETRGSAPTTFDDPEIAGLRQELLEASTQITRLEGEIAELKTAANSSSHAAEQARAQTEKLQGERRKLRDDLVKLKANLSDKEGELTAVIAARDVAEGRAAALTIELNKAEGALSVSEGEATRLRAEVDSLAAEREDTLPRLENAERELETTTRALREREVELEELRKTLTETQAARTLALRDVQALESLLAETDAERNTVKAMVAQLEAKLKDTTAELATTSKRLEEVEATAKALTISGAELEKERDALRRTLSEDTTGKDLVDVREQLRVVEQERESLTGRVEQLSSELEKGTSENRNLNEQLKSLVRELDEARRRAEAASEIRLRQDNEVLRGIIARQNSELEQKHVQLVKLKRARMALRLAYAAFGMGLLGVAVWAMKTVPGLQLGKIF